MARRAGGVTFQGRSASSSAAGPSKQRLGRFSLDFAAVSPARLATKKALGVSENPRGVLRAGSSKGVGFTGSRIKVASRMFFVKTAELIQQGGQFSACSCQAVVYALDLARKHSALN